jgi:hypothetical protein
MASGARLRDLTAGTDDTAPAWSPDGTNIVFTRAGDLFMIAADGAPGAERLLVQGGRYPTWGGTSSSPIEPTLPPPPVQPEPVPPPPADPPSMPPVNTNDPVQLAMATVAEQLQVAPELLSVLRVEPTDWSDASLGCPEPDRAYAEVITPGFLIVITDGIAEVQVHTDQGQRAVIC